MTEPQKHYAAIEGDRQVMSMPGVRFLLARIRRAEDELERLQSVVGEVDYEIIEAFLEGRD